MSNQYTYKPPFTEQQLFHEYVTLRLSQDEIAIRYKVSQHVVQRAMKKMGIKSRVAAKRDQRGAKNSYWKGGRVLTAKAGRQRGERTSFGNGYYYILDPLHPNADRKGYVAEHIRVATLASGRRLNKGEMVHHVDLDKHNNSPDNLAICTAKQHAIWHAQLEEIAVMFMRDGLIGFNAHEGYFRK